MADLQNDWTEIFRAGEQTDSQGRAQTFTHADLDQMVESHQAGVHAPLVVGHPRHNDPAYGWARELRRQGDSLQARFRDVMPEFAASVAAGHYRNRSVRVVKERGRWLVDHIGFLGAKRPAIPLDGLNYAARDGEAFDFQADAVTPGVLARAMRRLRDFLIEKFGAEAADRVLPDWDIEALAEQAQALRDQAPAATFAAPDHQDLQGDRSMPHSDEDLKRAREEARTQAQAEFAAQSQALQQQLDAERRARRMAEFTAEVGRLVDDERLTPAQAEGAAEFMAALDGEQQFEFAAADGKPAQKTPLDWFRGHLAALPKHGLTEELASQDATAAASEFAAPPGYAVDAQSADLDRRARAHMAAHPGTDYRAALAAVTA